MFEKPKAEAARIVGNWAIVPFGCVIVAWFVLVGRCHDPDDLWRWQSYRHN